MTAYKNLDRFCLVLACLTLAGCASLGSKEADTPAAGGQQAATRGGEDVHPDRVGDGSEAASASAGGRAAGEGHSPDGQPASGAGGETRSSRQGEDNALSSLLGSQSNYRFDIDAPFEFRETIERATLVGRWQRRKDYDEVQFEGLVGKLHDEVLAIARDKGYFNPEIEVSSDPPRQVGVKLVSGVRTHVNTLDFRIEGQGAGKRELSGVRLELGLAKGDVFLPGDWQKGKRAVVEAMQRQGYLRAKVSHSRVQVDAARGQANLVLTVDTGPRIAFGELHIQGLERYPARIIEDLKTFREGEPFT